MSLVNQLIAAIFAVLIGLVSGTLYIMSDSSRGIVQDQLESHAQDSATHLGLYLAPFIADDDAATVETAVNAIFDSGFYQQIIVTNIDDKVLFEKNAVSEHNGEAPDWFRALVKITPPSMHREVTYQWRQVGKIYVQSRAGYAYEKLWKGAQDSIILFVSLSIICLVAISTLIRYLLRPRQKVEDQAIALSEKRYIQQDKLPATRELKRVVQSMNNMVQQVRGMFEEQSRNIEELRKNAYQDNLTGLSNQRATSAQLAERIDYRKDFGRGMLINVHLIGLQTINQHIGLDKTNTLLKHLASLLQEMAKQADQSVLGRITGADFVLLVNQTDADLIQRRLQTIDEELRKQLCQFTGDETASPAISVGSCECSDSSSSQQLLTEARLASDSAAKEQLLWKQYDSQNQQAQAPQASDWKAHVANAIGQRDIFLQAQSVFSKSPDPMPLQDEIYARILDQDGNPAPAGEFINVVKELGLMAEMDKAVIELALSRADKHACPLTINLSHEAVTNDNFTQWLFKQLNTQQHGGKLTFELDETSILNNQTQVQQFREKLRSLNISFGVDHFGVHPSGFSYLYAIQPDYVKIDGSLIREVAENAEDKFFVSSLISVAHSLGVKAFAEHVETEIQLDTPQNLQADGSQGYLHGTPKRLD